MQPVRLSSQVSVLLPVRQLSSDRVAAFLLDDLSDEVWSRHIDYVKRPKPGAPDGSIQTLLNALEFHVSESLK